VLARPNRLTRGVDYRQVVRRTIFTFPSFRRTKIGPRPLSHTCAQWRVGRKSLVRFGVQVSTVHAVYAKKHFGATASEIKEYQTQDEANQDLAAGRLDAVQADSIALGEFLKSDQGKACCDLKGMVAPDDEVLGPGVGAGIRKEDTALKEKFNAGIKAIRANGKYDEISKKYFDFDIYGGATQSN
jgi:polar amino acid transport system substrate-binding protein